MSGIRGRLQRVGTTPGWGTELETSGTTGSKKKYLWGPRFDEAYRFFNSVFFGCDRDGWRYLGISEGCSDVSFSDDGRMIKLFPRCRSVDKIRNARLAISPCTFSFMLKRYDSISESFDWNTCCFYFSGSSKDSHITFLLSAGLISYKDYMRIWNGGATFFTCEHNNKHWIDISSDISIIDKTLYCTDFWNTSQMFIGQCTKDIVTWNRGKQCNCGLPIDEISIVGPEKSIVTKSKMYKIDSVLKNIHWLNNVVFYFECNELSEKVVLFVSDVVNPSVSEKQLAIDFFNGNLEIVKYNNSNDHVRKLRLVINRTTEPSR
jgi:hypothetical protein